MKKVFVFVLFIVILASCKKEDSGPRIPQAFSNGALIINQGNFLDNNGSISFLPKDSAFVRTNIFKTQNKRTLSGIIEDYIEINQKGIILVDNSSAGQDALEIVDNNFNSLASTPAGLIENPRHVSKVSDTKAYITCYGATGSGQDYFANPGYIAVLDLSTNTITKKIILPKGANDIIISGNDAFISSDENDTLTIVDIQNEVVTKKIKIDYLAIMGIDANGKLWLSAYGKLIRFNIQTLQIEKTITAGGLLVGEGFNNFILSNDKQTFYFNAQHYDKGVIGAAYSFNINAEALSPSSPFINKTFSGLGVDPQSGNIYAGFAPSYKQAGYVFRYKPTGALIDSVKAEIAPVKFIFR